MERRDFIKKSGTAAMVGAASTLAAPAVLAADKTFKWKAVTTWPPGFPILQTGFERFAKRLEIATNGRIKIKVHAGGELVPPLGTFDAVSEGTVEVGSAASYYWAGKIPAAQWFTAVPFGFNKLGINSWLKTGGGQELWEEIYAPHNVIPRAGGNTLMQAAGWFNKEIKTVKDFEGLKFRAPGLGGKVYSKLGATVVLLPGAEIVPALERGVLDAVEWVGPELDMRLGLHKVAKHFYYPGFHEPGSNLEIIFNKKAYESLPKDLQGIVDAVCDEAMEWSVAQTNALNSVALDKLMNEFKIKPKFYSKDIMKALRKTSEEVMEEEASKDAMAKKVHESYKAYKKKIGPWLTLVEKSYYNDVFDNFDEMFS